MAIAAVNIEVELREVFLKDRPQLLYDISLKGTIPVLQLSDGIVIDESIDIIKWALAQSSLEWYSSNTELQDKMIVHNDFEFKKWLDKYKYHDRNLENILDKYRNECSKTLHRYEIYLAESTYLLGENIQLVDVAIFPFVRQCANVDREWFSSRFPHTERWLEHWIHSELFRCVMPKYKVWKLDAPPLYILFHLGGE